MLDPYDPRKDGRDRQDDKMLWLPQPQMAREDDAHSLRPTDKNKEIRREKVKENTHP